jgi:hypothetical protein
VTATDPWTAFLDWLTTVMVPDWNELVNMLPLFLVLGVVGPIVTLLVLMWVWYVFQRERPRIETEELAAMPAERDAAGEPVFPPNVPFCRVHAAIYSPSHVRCDRDGAELSVICPIDATIRAASEQTCRVCGTRYVLGASTIPALVRRPGSPPPGGAAVA